MTVVNLPPIPTSRWTLPDGSLSREAYRFLIQLYARVGGTTDPNDDAVLLGITPPFVFDASAQSANLTPGAIPSPTVADDLSPVALPMDVPFDDLSPAPFPPDYAVRGPTFSAYRATAQSIPTGAFTKLAIDTEEWDTAGAFDTTLNRFTPPTAGYYQVNAAVGFEALTATTVTMSLYKNGTEYKRAPRLQTTGNPTGLTMSALVYLNGSTDYLEVFVFQNSGGAINTEVVGGLITNVVNGFSAALVRAL